LELSSVIALVHNILPPYRVPLFNALSTACRGDFAVLLTRETHGFNRSWRVPWEDVAFKVHRLRTVGFHVGGRAIDLSFGVGSALSSLNATAVIVAGWDLSASWSALLWARRRRVPAYAWVESTSASGSLRGPMSTYARRLFLRQCRGAIVPGVTAAAFVGELAPGLPWVQAPNAVNMPVNRAMREPQPPWSAIFVGELSKRKGFDIVLEAIPDLLADFAGLVVAGAGPLAGEIKAAAARDPRVRYLGFVEGENLVSAMNTASVVLVPSRQDPWPLVAVEALTAGRPVVLGPGVGSAADLEALAGNAVARVSALDGASLASAARRARTQVVPMSSREAFQPVLVAAHFLSILDEAAGGRR
jgi:glycosyltransferase involved in cell wall biosynthesis